MLLNKHFSKNIITISILSFLASSVYAKENNIQGVILSNNEITSNSTYSDTTNLYIDKSHEIQNITLSNEAILRMNGDSLAIGTIVKDDATISMYAHDTKEIGIPTIKDTISNRHK
ncbi:hypothetical protein G9394_03100 [Proteus vulgaris]|nr:hypothetical protein G9394_03100 [Proteus vulgaris]